MADAPTCKVILAGGVAKKLLAEVQDGLKQLNRSPLLVGFLASGDPASRVYADWTGKTARENGFQYELREVDREELEDALIKANGDDSVDGIMVYYPIFGTRQDQYLQNVVDVTKDVEGLTHKYISNMYRNVRFLDEAQLLKSVLPCTPLAVIKILEHLQIYNTILPYGNRLHGHTITVINRSEVVGRPLAALLANDGAVVYSKDIDDVQQYHRGEGLRKRRHEVEEKPGWGLEQILPLSDVVISGVPGDKFKVPVHLLREGAVCINFSSEKNFPPEVKQKASIYVPAIGKCTIAVLLRNLLRIVQNKSADTQSKPASAVEKEGTLEAAS
ncbi:Tetrahydrofolate dehydrogenase/cyclohydrolase [Lasiodiplodia theobromae]|uniref:Methylenetetrahydrofolate dehydrogenase [NAD(+)] n=2 Tax=Lasiodiplodia TaxID=66739 RepID=A0A5N5D5I3_9PEZI|nr:Methylenetetrahydrofolate dehydrogenase [Lasiodiplodia theobromae]KAB2572560.1 Methylenetetrahydrofolate dehydrogenase (NAD(+)) [Lasiodiplodia theobromae]KAF4536008.1 Methylenetetrahydrofolate dehydrogenase [Lasiodiplodia theobromae]KAF9633219.1 Tetrahydrofolate dehydrogenase/cyclohydrolase [Lasiodiplodia theobromae]KAK0663118.1 Methylenetetrahydrofolate dehydrogenase (NAD(+)) [Lasiodiplodia hormozganensis]